MKTYIQNISKKNLGISALIVGFLVGVLVVGIATAGMRDRRDIYRNERGGMHGDMQMSGKMSQDKDGAMMHDMQNMPGMSMEDMMKGMMGGLEGKTGLAFDQAFLAEMIVHHQGAVDMAKQVLATSKRPELIKLANDIIKAQEGEIEMMKKWQTEWVK